MVKNVGQLAQGGELRGSQFFKRSGRRWVLQGVDQILGGEDGGISCGCFGHCVGLQKKLDRVGDAC